MADQSPVVSGSSTPPVRRPATVAVHAGRPERAPDAPFNTPVTMASVYVAGGDVEYARYGNPTWRAVERKLCELEGAEAVAALDRMVDAANPEAALPAYDERMKPL